MSNIRAFTMPKWGIEMTQGVLAQWMVKEGDAFSRGQILCLIETDKITNEVEAEYDAVVKKIIVPQGEATHPVGALLAVFADAGASATEIDAFAGSFKAANTSVAAKAVTAPEAPEQSRKIQTNLPISPAALKLAEALDIDLAVIAGSGRNGRISYQDVYQASRPVAAPRLRGAAALPATPEKYYASPLARRLAALHGVDLSTVSGTGLRGRISKSDVLAQVKKTAAAGPFVPADNRPHIVPMDKIRKVVARRLTEAKSTIPHFYLRTTVKVDALLALRKTANLVLGVHATINDFLVRAAACALVQHRAMNIQVHGDDIHHFAHADISVAVATDKGLVTPLVRSADMMRIEQIAAATKDIVARAQAGKLSYADMVGGTFSISNLGMHGIEQFDAIINPPQGAILAVGGIQRTWCETSDGQGAFASLMMLSLSSDHRAIDGAAAAQFMATLKDLIETPEKLFAASS